METLLQEDREAPGNTDAPLGGRDAGKRFREINRLHHEAFSRLEGRDICVFLPHCLRSRECPAQTGEEGIRCRRCGRCPVGVVVKAAETCGMTAFCVPGGSALGPLIERYKPKGLVGVACEKELLLALDMLAGRGHPFQVFLLDKDGCFETQVDPEPILNLFHSLSIEKTMPKECAHMSREAMEVQATAPACSVQGTEDFRTRYLPLEFDHKSLAALCGDTPLVYDTVGPTRTVAEPLWHFLGQGGKGMRGTLFSLILEAFGKDPAQYRDYMLIPEWTHNGTLIVDDIEDGSSHRRGKPCLHLTYGMDVAINAGNALYFLSLLPLLRNPSLLSHETRNRIFQAYTQGMIRLHFGQGMDIAWHKGLLRVEEISEDNYLQMTRLKTGSLFWVSARISGILADLDPQIEDRLGAFASAMGIAFQVVDDLLDLQGDRFAKGKGGLGKDITEGKITLIVIYALKHAAAKHSARLKEILDMHTSETSLIREAIAILEACGATSYASRKAREILNHAYDQVSPCIPRGPAKTKIEQFANSLWKREI